MSVVRFNIGNDRKILSPLVRDKAFADITIDDLGGPGTIDPDFWAARIPTTVVIIEGEHIRVLKGDDGQND